MLRPARLWIYRLATCWMPETRLFGLKAALLCWCGAQVGTNVRLNSSVHIHPYPRNFRDKVTQIPLLEEAKCAIMTL